MSLLSFHISTNFPAENVEKQWLDFSKGVWRCTFAATVFPVPQLQMACYSTKYFMNCVIAFPQNANTVKEQGSSLPGLFDFILFFLQCVQWQGFWFEKKCGFCPGRGNHLSLQGTGCVISEMSSLMSHPAFFTLYVMMEVLPACPAWVKDHNEVSRGTAGAYASFQTLPMIF